MDGALEARRPHEGDPDSAANDNLAEVVHDYTSPQEAKDEAREGKEAVASLAQELAPEIEAVAQARKAYTKSQFGHGSLEETHRAVGDAEDALRQRALSVAASLEPRKLDSLIRELDARRVTFMHTNALLHSDSLEQALSEDEHEGALVGVVLGTLRRARTEQQG